MRADRKLAAATLAGLALFGAQKAVQAKAVMVPFIAVGGGWQTIVSYVNDFSGTTLHIAYNIKPIPITAGACLHADGHVRTSQNDLTSFIIDGTTASPATIYADTVGGAYAPVTGPNPHVGFMAVENTSGTNDSSLAVETITYNAGLRFLYAQRSIDLSHGAYGSALVFAGSTLPSGHTTKFMSFAPMDSRPHVYAVGVTTLAAGNLFTVPYNVPISLNKRNGQYWDRAENQYSDAASVSDRCVTLQPVCAPASAPTVGLISHLNCQAGTIFARVGGWFHLLNDGTPVSTPSVVNVIVFKVESNNAFGLAVTPLHPLLYTTE